MLHILDTVIEAVEEKLLAHPPERGGALLGPPGHALVSHFVADEWAPSSPIQYRPSRELAERVRRLEANLDLEFKGIVHSHPGGLPRPSEADRQALAEGLRRNPHLAQLLGLIAVRDGAPPFEAHEVPLTQGKLCCFAAYRAPDGQVRLTTLPVRVLPLRRDLETLRIRLGGSEPAEVFLARLGEEMLPAGRLLLPGGLELLFLIGEGYPLLPPVLLATIDGETEAVGLRWPLTAPPEERLIRAVEEFLWPPGPYRKAFGPPGGPAMTRDPAAARAAGWIPGFGGEPARKAEEIYEGLRQRTIGLAPGSLAGRRALIAGLGSVGSYLAEQLARAGVGALTLIDPERVEAVNLSRAIYEAADLGKPKVEAAAGRLWRIRPDLNLRLFQRSVQELSPKELAAEMEGADLVIAATDDPQAQHLLNHWAYARGKPALFIGLYARARGGEIIFTVPERTACYRCATKVRAGAGAWEPGVDYGAGRLRGEPALAADIQHVASAAVKLALALLARPGETEASELLNPALEEGMNYVTFSMAPGFWFYPYIFEGVPGQHAFQSVWLTPTRDSDCPICGNPEGRVDPAEMSLHGPALSQLRGLAHASKPGEPEAGG